MVGCVSSDDTYMSLALWGFHMDICVVKYDERTREFLPKKW